MAEPHQPNSFQLAGDDIAVTYDETSVTGEPQFTYRNGSREVSRRGDEIRREETSIGTLVTVELEAVPDLKVVEVTVLIPRINLRNREVEFESFEIETTSHTSVGGPAMIDGPLQTYCTRALKGTARFLEF
jgi:hypothetical protein